MRFEVGDRLLCGEFEFTVVGFDQRGNPVDFNGFVFQRKHCKYAEEVTEWFPDEDWGWE